MAFLTVNQLYQKLNETIPPSLSCEWDNDGLMCCPNGEREVRRILLTLDVTAAAVARATEGGYDLILSHHPLIFKGLRALNDGNAVAAKAMTLVREGISVFSFHTRLDAVGGGVNDVLADLLGLENTVSFGEEGIGRIGTLAEPMAAEDFARLVKERLCAPFVLLADGGVPSHRVAVLGGNGSDDLAAAMAAGADTFVSGELKYHSLVDAPEERINLIEAGHFFTENPILPTLKQQLLALDPTLTCDLFYSNETKVV